MITFLRRLFVPNFQNTHDETVRSAHGRLAAWIGIVSNFLLVAMKLVAAFYIASQTSAWIFPVAIIGDAINNLSDMASSLVTLIGFKISAKPADKEHPFGHERIEYIAGLIVSTIVLVLGVELARDSITKIINGDTVTYDVIAIIILGVSILIKLLQSYVNFGLGKAIDSPALKATATDSFTDSIATSAILISAILSLPNVLGWNFLDGYMGIVVAVFVCYSGIKMLKETADPLIGESNNKDIVKEVVACVLSHKEIIGVHDVLCHSYGPTKYFVTLHAEINQNMPMVEAHDIIDNVEGEIEDKFHVDITIHMDPVAVGDPETDALHAEVKDELKTISPSLSFHDFRIVKGPTHTNVIFDILLPYDEKITETTILEKLNARFAKRKTRIKFVIHFDRPYTE